MSCVSKPQDVALKDFWKNFKTQYNEITVASWYNLDMTVNNIFHSKNVYYNLYIPNSVFILIAILLFHSSLTEFILPIFSLSSNVTFNCSLVVNKISKHAEFWRKKRQSGKGRLKLLPQMSHKDSTLMLFLPLCIWECLRMSQFILWKWSGGALTDNFFHHSQCPIIFNCIHMVVPEMCLFILVNAFHQSIYIKLHTSLYVTHAILRVKFHNINVMSFSFENETPVSSSIFTAWDLYTRPFHCNCTGHPVMAADITVLTGRSGPPSMVSGLTQVLIYNWTEWGL